MFGGNTEQDLHIMITMVATSFVFGLFIYFFSRRKILSLFVFSSLANLSVYLTYAIGSLVFRFYDLRWLQDFSIYIWPIINLILFVILLGLFVKNVIRKNKR